MARAVRVRPRCSSGGWRSGLALFEWVGLLGLTAVYARGSGRRLDRGAARCACRPRPAVAGALLIGSSAWLVVGLLVEWVLPPPKELVEEPAPRDHAGRGTGRFALALLLTAFTPAICEEALFRGPILRGLRTRFSAARARPSLTGLLFGLFHGSVWRFIPTAVLGFAPVGRSRSPADSIVPAMIAHFANNACIIALASRRHRTRTAPMSAKLRLALVALGSVGPRRRRRRCSPATTGRAESAARPRMTLQTIGCSLLHEVFVVGTRLLC